MRCQHPKGDEKERMWASHGSLNTDLTPLTADEFTIIVVLAPFHQATVELSEEKSFRVKGHPDDENAVSCT